MNKVGKVLLSSPVAQVFSGLWLILFGVNLFTGEGFANLEQLLLSITFYEMYLWRKEDETSNS